MIHFFRILDPLINLNLKISFQIEERIKRRLQFDIFLSIYVDNYRIMCHCISVNDSQCHINEILVRDNDVILCSYGNLHILLDR